ncbi:MAG: hypothetical protein V4805_12660, partial [Pseudomonadota bacterium]
MKKIILSSLISILSLSVSYAEEIVAPVRAAADVNENAIHDVQGRILYMVVLGKNAHKGFTAQRNTQQRANFEERHSDQAQNMVEAFEAKYGFVRVGMTSWVGNTFSAYLTLEQVKRLQRDPLVTAIEEAIPVSFSSAGPPWSNSPNPANSLETFSWGRNAVAGKTSNNTRRIYIIDSGVGFHQDLQNVQRVNPNTGASPVGCYAHSTHVAGIIGAA